MSTTYFKPENQPDLQTHNSALQDEPEMLLLPFPTCDYCGKRLVSHKHTNRGRKKHYCNATCRWHYFQKVQTNAMVTSAIERLSADYGIGEFVVQLSNKAILLVIWELGYTYNKGKWE